MASDPVYLNIKIHNFLHKSNVIIMMKIKCSIYRLALSCVPIFLGSCIFLAGSPSEYEIQKDVPIKWSGVDTGITKLLNIDGFFCASSYLGDSCVSTCSDSPLVHRGMAFFDDGTYVQFCSKKKNLNNKAERISISESGVYVLSHDTIIAEVFIRDSTKLLSKKHYPILKRFKIIDRNTIVEIDSYNLHNGGYYNKALIRSLGQYIKNIPASDMMICSFSNTYKFPTADIKIKENRWLWANEKDWNIWMAHKQYLDKEKKTYTIKYND